MGFPDEYVIRARVAPVILISLPFLMMVISDLLTGPELQNLALMGLVGVAVITLLAQIGRDRGKKIEPNLFDTWGGKPTTVWLRHSDNHMDPDTKKRIHTCLSSKIDGLQCPTVQDEKKDPIAADQIYDSAVNWLRSNTSDKQKFPRLFGDNVDYGFRRNLLGLKPFGFILYGGLLGYKLYFLSPLTIQKAKNLLSEPTLLAVLVGVLVLTFIVTKSWVKDAADSYAFALINASESI